MPECRHVKSGAHKARVDQVYLTSGAPPAKQQQLCSPGFAALKTCVTVRKGRDGRKEGIRACYMACSYPGLIASAAGVLTI